MSLKCCMFVVILTSRCIKKLGINGEPLRYYANKVMKVSD